jgi:hypothetical protein
LGTDLSKRVGLGTIASPMPFVREGNSVQQTAGNVVLGALGAPASMAVNMIDGVGKLFSGEPEKGIEKIVPLKAAKDLVKSYRYTDEGLTDVNGKVILPDTAFDPWEIAMRGIGFTTTKESEYYAANNAVQTAKRAAEQTRQKLLDAYAKAKLAGESTTEIDGKILEFNERHPTKGVRIDHSTKLKSLQNNRKMQKERNEAGVRTGRGYEPYVAEGRFAE